MLKLLPRTTMAHLHCQRLEMAQLSSWFLMLRLVFSIMLPQHLQLRSDSNGVMELQTVALQS